MHFKKLPNYLRTYRKHAGFSQDEVSYLLGCKSGSKVSRYERFSRTPTLETAFAFEATFQISASELFAGIFEKVEAEIVKRARLLARRLEKARPNRMTERKLEVLKAISSAKAMGDERNL